MRSGWYLWSFWSTFGCATARWSVCSTNENSQAWPTELFYRCSSRLELTSTTSLLPVHKSGTFSSWAQDSSLQGSLHWQPRRTIVEEWFELNWTEMNSNLGTILPRFRVIAGYLLKTVTPPLFHPKFGDVLLGLDFRCWGSEERRPYANYSI